jgi:hypothetical protein
MHAVAEVAEVLSTSPVTEIMAACTYPHRPLLTGECDLMQNTTGSWHKDITDGMDLGSGIYGAEDFTVYKLALYLQDQVAGSRGVLKVKPGSHRRERAGDLPATEVVVRAGDAVVFDVRLDHAGQLPSLSGRIAHRLLAGAATLSRREAAERWFTAARAAVRQVRAAGDRMAVFATFGPATDCTFTYERAGRVWHGVPPRPFDPAVLASLDARGVGLIESL